MAIESMPDSGVEIIKEVTAPLLAPCFCSVTAAGSTPHDQSGMGIPNKAASKTGLKRPFPRCRTIVFGLRKTRNNPLRASAVIAIIMQRDPDERIPEWEEIASVAAAVQNMWLTCTAHGIGAYWSTPQAILQGTGFLGLGEGERCLGLFYMGHYDREEIPGKRGSIEEKVEWVG